MSPPRLRSIELEYGCHSGRFDLPDRGRPVVISGRNGSGKTTLLEAFLRTLYGFSRRKPEERRLLELRRPWSGRPAEAEVRLIAADGTRVVVRRNFTTDEVVATAEQSALELFRGDGNPAGVRSQSRHYQDLLRDWIGFGDLEPYRGTAWIAQGELVETKLDDELLRAAAGTHRRVEVALTELRDAFEALTREPIELGGRRKNRAREVENLQDAVDDMVRRLDVARASREKKRPLLERTGEIRRKLEGVEREIELLEAAYRPITERRTLVAERREAESRLSALSDAVRWLGETAGALARAEAEAAAAGVGGRYPEDFEARIGQAEVLWDRLDALTRQRAEAVGTGPGSSSGVPVAALPGLAAIFAGALVAVAWSVAIGSVLAVSGLILGAALLWRARSADAGSEVKRARRAEDELARIRSRLGEIEKDVPQPSLTPASMEEHRLRFRGQSAADAGVRRARERHLEATERAESLLEHSSGAGEPGEGGEAFRRLEEEREVARTALARIQLRLEEQPAAPVLPDGVEPTVPAVETAREERRERRRHLTEELNRLDLEIRDMDRAFEDVFALERELAGLREKARDAQCEAVAGRYAWELVRDAYEEFRSTDQARLLSAINLRMRQISGGRLGPVETAGDLSAAQVGLDGRMMALDSPPLSFGEKHASLLAIRLGTADFLAGGDGTRHPLLIDEPFTHLDEVRSREVWELLEDLASARQVIITTQDRLVLQHLGIEADIDLAVPTPGDDDSVERRPDAERSVPRSGGRALVPHEDHRDAEEAGPSPTPPPPVQEQLELG
ncbi:MAG: AAA family ATPase [Candidatus Palauibacterales bacterium]|nr:AAA family ATPase [Candidatus Palauibacterales bacterium]MDP2483092.1 AAA family ATPase [Candidatus Palauibacterales bacterium]